MKLLLTTLKKDSRRRRIGKRKWKKELLKDRLHKRRKEQKKT